MLQSVHTLATKKRLKNGECTWIVTCSPFKGVVYDCNPIHFLSDSENISSRSARFPFCVHAERKVCCSYTAALALQTGNKPESPTQVVKCRRFSCVSTEHFSIICHNSCSCTGQTNAASYSSLKGGVCLFGCWVQMSTSFLQNRRLHL